MHQGGPAGLVFGEAEQPGQSAHGPVEVMEQVVVVDEHDVSLGLALPGVGEVEQDPGE